MYVCAGGGGGGRGLRQQHDSQDHIAARDKKGLFCFCFVVVFLLTRSQCHLPGGIEFPTPPNV